MAARSNVFVDVDDDVVVCFVCSYVGILGSSSANMMSHLLVMRWQTFMMCCV